MKKIWKKSLTFVMWLLGIIVSLAIGGYFVAGGFTNVFLLKYLPLLVHQIVGWILIVSTIIGAIWHLIK